MREKLKILRLQKELSVAEIARKFGISSSFYYKIEAGTRNPTMHLAKQIADFFDREIEELFFNQDLDEMSNKETHSA